MIKEWDQVVLGTIFMTNFVTSFDMDNNTISLTANTNAPEGVGITAIKIKSDDDDGLSGGAIAGIVIGGIVLLILVFVGIYCLTCKGSKGNGAQGQNFSIIEQD